MNEEVRRYLVFGIRNILGGGGRIFVSEKDGGPLLSLPNLVSFSTTEITIHSP